MKTLLACVGLSGALWGCAADPPREADRRDAAVRAIETVVVIYAENRAFDTLYGLYPGADGVPGVNPSGPAHAAPQRDRDGSVMAALPPVWGGLSGPDQPVSLSPAQTAGLPNRAFRIDDPQGLNGSGQVVPASVVTRDLVHRFYNNQMQIGEGANDHFAAYSDAGALTMGYYDGSTMRLWSLARQYTLADHFFMGAFGGSFLNHQYLICACAPVVEDVAHSPARGEVSAIDVDTQGRFVRLTPAADMPRSALGGPPRYLRDAALTPPDEQGRAYAVNTMQPAYQPSGRAPLPGGDPRWADPAQPTTLPPQTAPTIAERLDARGVTWAWYAGGWDAVSAGTALSRRNIYGGERQFQPHHQPFNYYARFDPRTHAGDRAQHLLDFDARFLADAAAGRLPQVAFYKPQGVLNQHPGYASVASGDDHIADVVEQLQRSPQWPHMLILITYDENGGFYDHARVPRGDRWGPGSRIPALIVSPYARRGYVDKTPYDTGSILRFLTRRWDLDPLPGVRERDQALQAHGEVPMGDFSAALRAP